MILEKSWEMLIEYYNALFWAPTELEHLKLKFLNKSEMLGTFYALDFIIIVVESNWFQNHCLLLHLLLSIIKHNF